MRQPIAWIAPCAAISLAGCLVGFEDYPAVSADASVGQGGTSGGGGGVGGGLGGGAGGVGGAGVGGGGVGGGAAGGSAGADAAATGGTAGTAGDGGGGAGGLTAPCVNGLLPITDDFEDGNLTDDPKWKILSNGVAPSEMQGQLVLGWSGNPSAVVSGGIDSTSLFRLTDCAVEIEVIELPLAGGSAFLSLALSIDASNYIQLGSQGGFLGATAVVNGTPQTYGTLAFQPSAHRWWRIRGQGTFVHFEVSSDASSWTSVAGPIAAPFVIDKLRLVIRGGTTLPEAASAGIARLDNLNLP